MGRVFFDAGRRLWLLTTAATSYVLYLDDEDAPRNAYWGPALTPAEAASIHSAIRPGVTTFDGPIDDELPVEGGARFDAPSLQLKFADGTKAFEWRHLDHAVDGEHLRIRFSDRHYPLELTLHYRVAGDSDVIERWTSLRHTGTRDPIMVLRCDSASWVLPCRTGYRITHVTGGWASEFQTRLTTTPYGETVFTSRRGTTSHQANPWLMVQDGNEVWSGALAWSGSWRIVFRYKHSGQAGWSGGFGHDGVSWALAPGEELATPVFAGLYTAGGTGAASRHWHEYIRSRVLPHPGEIRPVVYNSWEATQFDMDESKQRLLAVRAAELGCELFVVDDGWFSGRTHDAAGLGDWEVDRERFPRGLDPLIAEVQRLGMRFGLWVEPEMVNPDSELYREHPDWVLHMPHRDRTELRHQLVLNFARSDVAEWAHKWLDRLVGKHGIDFLKWDMNRPFTEAGWPAERDQDRLWTDHVRNVYAVVDRLRADHPGLRIEGCSGGGGRIDLGMLSRTDQAWPSDNTDAFDRIAIQHGYSRLYPAGTMSAWVTDSPNQLSARHIPLAFRFHVAMSGVLGIGGNLLAWSEEELTEAKSLVAQYKSIRNVVQHGSRYDLTAGPVSAAQYVLADESVVLVWRPFTRFGEPEPRLRLEGLDPGADYNDGRDVHHGAVLMQHGIEPTVPRGDYGSTLIHLRKCGPSPGR